MKLKIQCPNIFCQHVLRSVELTPGAQTVADRDCRWCEASWRIVVRPSRIEGVDKLQWTQTGEPTKTRCDECDACQEFMLTPWQAPVCCRMKPIIKERL